MDCRDEMTHASKAERIRELNDRLRTTGLGGRTLLTRAFAALPQDQMLQILARIRQFDDFDGGNDPWREHDFGQVGHDGARYFWKIDVYDVNLEFGSPDPSDETVTCRVLTVMTEQDL
ncbi:hypothetical protein M2336_000296 [Sphingobium sp. B1D7B]|uniref:DUF3768 domain-containing protein n=1 Tax=unclassified Sphingobium TaxID=2611147 RepID=UPI0022246EDB|nr:MULTISPECIES: DUF3768 domain-containing protein [unclassified Sphingobium]MCW2391911.1 hypothetical protein [Sphingobium sp. B11D3A]MCW2403667.1 hypothetical protein [Sphingobium sp. B1D7B]